MKNIAIFNSARDVVKVENCCRKQGLNVSVIPVPEIYSTECGMCLLFDDGQKNELTNLIESMNINTKIYNYEQRF